MAEDKRRKYLALTAVGILAACALFVAYAGSGGYMIAPQSAREPHPARGRNASIPEVGTYAPRCADYCIQKGCNKWVGCAKCEALSDVAQTPDKGSEQECCKVFCNKFYGCKKCAASP